MCHYYTVQCTDIARSIITVPTNTVVMPQLRYNAISTTFSHQILHNIVRDFYLCWQNSKTFTVYWYATPLVNMQFLNSICQQILLSTLLQYIIILLYSSHGESDENNDITTPLLLGTPWSSLEHKIAPDYLLSYLWTLLQPTPPQTSLTPSLQNTVITHILSSPILSSK